MKKVHYNRMTSDGVAWVCSGCADWHVHEPYNAEKHELSGDDLARMKIDRDIHLGQTTVFDMEWFKGMAGL